MAGTAALIATLALFTESSGSSVFAGMVADPVSWQVNLGRLGLVFFFVLLNGFFVAAEFAIVKVRPSQLDETIDKLSEPAENRGAQSRNRAALRRARRTRHIAENLDAYLSATQLGITIASIALGMVVEPLVAAMIAPFFHSLGLSHPPLIHSAAVAVSLAAVIYLHVVLGELIPKSLALRKALPTAMGLAAPLHYFHGLFAPAIHLFKGTANCLLRRVFRLDPASGLEGNHSAEELRILVNETGAAKDVTEIEREILINALELHDLSARRIMLARNEVVSLDINDPYPENYEKALAAKHTRYPLIDGHLDHTVGLIHVKDLMRLGPDAKVRLQDIAKPLDPIPEQMPLDVLLQKFLGTKAHMALVVDEYGGSLGIVTLDNVLEELVGDIQDEFDEEEMEPDEFVRLSDDEFVVDGSMPLHELAEETDLRLEDPEVDTVGGFVTHLLGRLPDAGEQVRVRDYVATVTETDGKVVGKLQFRRQPDAEESAEEAESDESKEVERLLA